MEPAEWPWANLPLHADLIARLAAAVEESAAWRWLEVGCSLASGRGDPRSDIDAGIGYDDHLGVDEMVEAATRLVHSIGPALDLLVHRLAERPDDTRRFAVELAIGVQLDLVLMPEHRRPGLPSGSRAVVDKDGRLATAWRPDIQGPPRPEQLREWLMLAWWALSDVAKYLARGSLHEAVAQLAEARGHALRLYAAATATPFAAFGLVSLLDYPPFELPPSLADCYALPHHSADVLVAALATADLLETSARAAGSALAVALDTPWSAIARARLAATSRVDG